MQKPKIKLDHQTGKYYYDQSKKSTEIKAVVDHLCMSCKAPIYDKKPVCGVCFKAGKYPKSMWKQPQSQPTAKSRKRRLKKLKKQEMKPKKQKTFRPKKQSNPNTLKKLGTIAYYKLKREGKL